jgi:UDP-2,3-diacylglucosamine pyrophosphatase LpxH
MKYLILSDAHIGLGDVKRDKTLVNQIIAESIKYDKVVFNGDMIETWKYGKMGFDITMRTSKVKEIFNNIPELKKFMNSDKCEVLIGNHDITLERFGFKNKSLHIKDDNTSTYVIHGNECSVETSYDYIKSKNSWWVILGAWMSYKLTELSTNLGFSTITEGEDKWDDIHYQYSNTTEDVMLKYANELNSEIKASTYVVGHTHDGTTKKLRTGKTLFNCGKCSVNDLQGIIVSTKDAIVKKR